MQGAEMEFGRRFKVVWWGATLIFFGCAGAWRSPEIVGGHGSVVDVAVIALFFGLMLVPIYSEVSVLGVTLKGAAGDIKNIHDQISNVATASAVANTTFNFSAPPDDQLPKLASLIATQLSTQQEIIGSAIVPTASPTAMPDDVMLVYGAHYNIMREVERLAKATPQIAQAWRRAEPEGVMGQIAGLQHFNVVSFEFGYSVMQVFGTTIGFMHDQPVTDAQVKFLRETAPGIISTLQQIHPK